MKLKIFLTFSIITALIGCDHIDQPLKDGVTTGNNDSNTVAVQRVFLEEFTGVKCSNCPEANAEAKTLQSIYGDQLILIGIHAGNFAQTDNKHPRAFRTQEGTELFTFFQVFGVPSAFVNRTDYGTGLIAKVKDSWSSEIGEIVTKNPVAEISLKQESFNTDTRTLSISGTVEVLGDLNATDVYISIFLAENDIISAQTLKDYTVDPDYEHDHVFRGAFNTTFGEQIDLTTQNNASFSGSMVLDSEIVKENCEVIAFIYNRDTYEIIQANKIEI